MTEVTFAFDLHVLAMPPAFNLSQDQTLQLNIVVTSQGLVLTSNEVFDL